MRLVVLDSLWHTYGYPMKVASTQDRQFSVRLIGFRDFFKNSGQVSFFNKTWGSWKVAAAASSAAMVFAVAILLLSLLAVSNPLKVYPQTITPTPTPEQTVKVNYSLPYPGVLPDSPLYRIKAVRDRVVLWLTRGEERKAEKELLYADKRINAAIALTEGGKVAEGVSTATKAEKYLQSAVNRTVKASSQGKDVKSLLLKLNDACAKHAEVLTELAEKTDGTQRTVLEGTLSETKALGEKSAQALRESK